MLMRKKTLSVLTGVLSLALLARANDIEPGKEYYSVLRAQNPIVLDGNLSEWTGIPVLADPKFYIRNGADGQPLEGTAQGKGSGGTNATLVLFERCAACIGGTPDWTGPDDQTSAVQIAYDADNVYFGFVVTDDYHENAANSAWNGDSVQLMIADAARTNIVALYNYALGGTENNLGSVIVEHERGPATDAACGCATTAVITRNAATHKTIYEIKLPKASLGLTNLIAGTNEALVQFGLGMAINDGDQFAPGQGGWGGLGAHAIVFGKTPSETALMTLVRRNDIEPGKEAYTATPLPGTFNLDGNLSEWTGVPVLADPKFYIRNGANGQPLEGTAQGKGSGGSNATLVLFERCAACIGGTPDWTGPDDQTSAVQIAFDADNVYFGFVVTDEYHENAANSAWNGDSVQLMIANSNLTSQVALYNYALGGVEGNLGSVIVEHEAGPGGTTAIVTRNATTHRTIYEIKLPASSLGLTAPLKFGDRFGLGMAINDGDQFAPGQGGWGGLGAHSIVFGKTPSETAFVTLGTAVASADRLFFSAIVQTLETFSFRANDKGPSIVDPATARLIIDGVTNIPTASPRVLDSIDFSYTNSPPFAPGAVHSYVIVVKDTLGNTVTSQGTFTTPRYPLLLASDQVTPDTSQIGYIWKVHQNSSFLPNSISRAQYQLAGLLGRNFADPDAQGPSFTRGVAGPTVNDPLTFQIELDGGLLNLNQDDAGAAGDFTPDFQMPGIPGLTFENDGIAAEITVFVELPAGWVTNIVNSEDNFRTTVGNINDLFRAQLAGEFDQPSGRTPADTIFPIRVHVPGVYAFRTVFEAGANGASIEWKLLKPDGTKVLLDDISGGGFRIYRKLAAGSALPTGINMVSPLPGSFAPTGSRIFASIQEGSTTVDLNSVRLKLDAGAPIAVTPTRVGNLVSFSYSPSPALSATQHTAALSFTAGGISRTQSWNFTLQGPQPQLVWMVGRDDNAWPAGDGGGPNASFVQENGVINPLPGVPNSPEVNQQADNDYYFAGSYTTVIPSVTARYGNYTPVGAVAVNEEAAERAFAGGDLDLRYHFNLPATLQPTDLLSVTFDANNLDSPGSGTTPDPTDPRFGIEVYFNGVLVQTQILIRAAQLDVDYTTPLFSLASVNAQVGPGFDNIVSLKGVSYLAEGGGNWMGIDYVQLTSTPGAPEVRIGIQRSGTQVTISWNGGGTLQETATLPAVGVPSWAPVAGNPASPYTFTPATTGNRFYRVVQ